MIDKKTKEKVIELFKKNTPQTQIAKELGISRSSVRKIVKKIPIEKPKTSLAVELNSDLENDTEILKLKKQLRTAELSKKIRELKKPLEIETTLNALKLEVKELNESLEEAHENIADLYIKLYPNPLQGLGKCICRACDTKGKFMVHIRCSACGSDTLFGWRA